MLKPLTQDQTETILRTAAEEFADCGFARAGISSIAKKAGVSVGVIYKYYADKEDLFNACVDKSLEALNDVFELTEQSDRPLMERIGELITQIQKFARQNPEYFRLYHQITVSGTPLRSTHGAELIESRSASLYRTLITEAQAAGEIRRDADPALFAFFFDNLLMMLHFSYACGYYEDRFRIYCGDDVTSRDEEVKRQLLTFIGGALHGVHTGL